MLRQILLGALMIGITTSIHAVFMFGGLQFVRSRGLLDRSVNSLHATGVVSLFVIIMFLASVVEVWTWAALYVAAGSFGSLEPALYFSTVTYTTLGYGDIVLDEVSRLLSAFQAANGIIMFGWTTALVIAVIQRAYVLRESAG